jgi:hypothetical protein
VGLLLKGFEMTGPETVQEYRKEEDIPEFIEESEKTGKHNRSFGEFIENFKTSIGGFFDDGSDKNM